MWHLECFCSCLKLCVHECVVIIEWNNMSLKCHQSLEDQTKKKTLFFCLLFTKLSAEARMSDSSELSDKVTGDIHWARFFQ